MSQQLTYTLTRSKRRSISLTIDDHGELQVKAPNRVPKFVIDTFVISKANWIEQILAKRQKRTNANPVPELTHEEISCIKQEFKNDMVIFMEEQAQRMNLSYNALKLSSARSRWGSCSSKKTINLNWRLALVPQELREYVAIHELAHLKHMNHSKNFWDLVAEFDPNYKTHRNELKAYSHFLKEL